METESKDHQSERCEGTSMMRREADAEPSEDVAEPDHVVSGADGTGQENEELEWMRRHAAASLKPSEQKSAPCDSTSCGLNPVQRAPMLVDRKTEIIGCGVPVNKKKKILPLSDMEVLRKRIRTIMDEQDRIQEDMFLRWNSLNHRVEDLEDEVEALKSMETTKDQEVPG